MKKWTVKLSVVILAVLALMVGGMSVSAAPYTEDDSVVFTAETADTADNTAVSAPEQTDTNDNTAVSAPEQTDTNDNTAVSAVEHSSYNNNNYQSQNQPPVPNSSRSYRPVNWLKIIGIALGASLLITGIAVAVIYSGYKYNGRTEPYPYTRKAPLELADTEDTLINTDVQRERIQRNN